ncbi:Exodeoxyribonuclease V beta chain [Candidatus Similichlamydia laticola]|uniref:DNA 3'-5' helicase n=1 Tax=Candidatus Similichlamydia laticola TaxID=2170265 RepID=A0A369KJJ9_9BACT|nr:Exodeoxyribonuclease V beta chain [Candidatus Similichlamydia laticola]
MTQAFNVLSRDFESSGSFVIEASAGTGKTFSIEHLFIRALLEGMQPENILMMTFTRKAARQLVTRIRKALTSFCALCSSQKEDREQFPDYFQPYLEANSFHKVKRFLKMGLEGVDRLPIFTIHGFCQFLLQQDHVFQLPALVNSSVWLQQIGPIYLARYLHATLGTESFPLRYEEWDYLVEQRWSFSSFSLYQDLLGQENVYPIRHRDLSWEQTLVSLRYRFLKFGLSPSLIWEECLKAQFPFRGFSTEKSLKKNILNSCLQALSSRKIDLLSLHAIGSGLSLIGSDLLLKRFRGPLDLSWADLLKKEFRRELRYLAKGHLFISKLVAHLSASPWWQSVQAYKGAQPDVLLTMLLEKLGKQEAFLKECREKFSYVIIDEFQDTDPLQWKIFDLLFSPPSPVRLVLVGDPKQSIYSFRRSDVYTYFKASTSLSQSYTLEKNFRSQSSLIETLNLLFSSSKDWMFLPKTKQSIHPVSVSAHHLDQVSEQRVHFLSWDGSWSSLFRETALRIYHLIQHGFCPSQIAVLVSRHTMAKEFLKEMEGIPVHVPRIFPEEMKTVACWMWAILTSVWDQTVHCLPRLLLTPFFGFDWNLLHQSQIWLDVKCILHYLFQVYRDEGLPALFAALTQVHWKNRTLGEAFQEETSLRERLIWRQLISSLFEKEKRSPASILDWLLRLMSGQHVLGEILPQNYLAPAVQLLTIHASKGLEFDCVFALGLADRSSSRTSLDARWVQLEEGDISTVLGASLPSKELESYLDECDAEKLRLLYVALTRAKEHLFVPLPSAKKMKTSPKRGSAAPIELFAASFSASGRDYKALYQVIAEGFFEEFQHFLKEKNLLAQPLAHSEREPLKEQLLLPQKEKAVVWKPSRFYQLCSQAHSKILFTKSITAPLSSSWSNWMDLPRGSQIGTFLHELLSRLVIDRHFCLSYWKEMMGTRAPCPMKEEEQENLLFLLKGTLTRKLPCLDVSLEEIPAHQCVTEFPFCFSGMRRHGDLWKGVIDLLIQKDQQVFLLDWKSNWLGSEPSCYSEEHLMRCCEEHGYLEQIGLYASAVTRRLEGSSLTFGGSILFFLRAERGLFFHAR